jgi:hypothetical protein
MQFKSSVVQNNDHTTGWKEGKKNLISGKREIFPFPRSTERFFWTSQESQGSTSTSPHCMQLKHNFFS